MTESRYVNGRAAPKGAPRPRKKMRIYQEEAKLRQITHWDLDYMTSAELDALMSTANKKGRDLGPMQSATGRRRFNVGRHLPLTFVALTLIGGLLWGIFFAKPGIL